jgi:hypothetical protein
MTPSGRPVPVVVEAESVPPWNRTVRHRSKHTWDETTM